MAEFQEVIKQWRRMCKKTQRENSAASFGVCSKCSINEICVADGLSDLEYGEIAIIEECVMQWAAEHPEPVYPTWWEYLTRIHVIFPAMGDFQKCVDDLATKPIPADIAEKLGIEPKEG